LLLTTKMSQERGAMSDRVMNEMRRLEEIRDQCCRLRESAAADVAAERKVPHTACSILALEISRVCCKALCEDRAVLLRQQQEVTQSELAGVRRLTEWEARLNKLKDDLAAAKESFESERRQAATFMATVAKERDGFAREKAALEKQQVCGIEEGAHAKAFDTR
jgi:hypothetical protein